MKRDDTINSSTSNSSFKFMRPSFFKVEINETALSKADFSLVVFESTLINTANGEYRQITENTALGFAKAASSLLGQPDSTLAKVLLLLPPNEFFSTTFDMAIANDQHLRSALQLQAHTMVPGYEEELLLGLDATKPKGVALWFSAQRASALFKAFNDEGLFLTALMPRTFAPWNEVSNTQGLYIKDEDGSDCTQLSIYKESIQSFLTTSREDLKQEDFADQWEHSSSQLEAMSTVEFLTLEDWLELKQKVSALPNYCFIPKAAQQAANKTAINKRNKFIGKLGLAAVLLLGLPFIGLWAKSIILESQLEEVQADSSEARRLQASIIAVEEEWGPLVDFPEQNVAEVLLTLNQVNGLGGSLTSFSLEQGVLEIEGTTQNPTSLVAILSETGKFTEIAQSRSISGTNDATRGDRFGIRMSLMNINFEKYIEKYPELKK